MKRVTYPTDDGGAIHEYVKEKKMGTGENKLRMGKLFVKDMETGECFEFDGLRPLEMDTVEQPDVPDGISIHIFGTDINRISDINICFKEDE